MDLSSIKKFLDSGAGVGMKEYLIVKLNELKNIDNINEKDVATQQVIEVKGQKRAYQKIKEILQDIMTFNESVRVKDPRDNYGVTDEDLE